MNAVDGPDPALVRSAAHVFVESLEDPTLQPDDRHHLGRVLRLRDGEPVSVTDGRGRWRRCDFRAASASVAPAGEINEEPAELERCGVAVSVPKGDRIDGIVQKLTELGVDDIILLRSDRSVVKWDRAQADKHLVRLRSIARSAAMQSRRLRLPDLSVTERLEDVLSIGNVGVAMIGSPPLPRETTLRAIVVGPEGGWSPRECQLVAAGGHTPLDLGRTVLRTDTAAIAAAVLLCVAPRWR